MAAQSHTTDDPSNGSCQKPRRVLYVAGGGDVIGTYRCWREGRDDPSQVARTYSGQFYDVCHALGIHATVIGYHPRQERIEEDGFTIEHRPMRLSSWHGPFYHLGQYWFHLAVVWRAIRDRCDIVFPATEAHLAPYWIAVANKMDVVPINHCTLWPKRRRFGLDALVRFFDKQFFRRGCSSIMVASKEISDQIDELTGGVHPPFAEFLPNYRRDMFAEIPKADHSARPFRVLFAGRIEENKGVFDLLEIATDLLQRRHDIVFDIAGDGSTMVELRQRAIALGLDNIFHFHGLWQQPKMR